MFTKSYKNGIIPESLREALTILLPKPNKPSNKFESYWPISLLNKEVKILSKILASRLENLSPDIARQDQNGFIHGH